MGHYDDAYEYDERKAKEARLEQSLEEFAEITEPLQQLHWFVHSQTTHGDRKKENKSLAEAFRVFEDSIIAWRYRENHFIEIYDSRNKKGKK